MDLRGSVIGGVAGSGGAATGVTIVGAGAGAPAGGVTSVGVVDAIVLGCPFKKIYYLLTNLCVEPFLRLVSKGNDHKFLLCYLVIQVYSVS